MSGICALLYHFILLMPDDFTYEGKYWRGWGLGVECWRGEGGGGGEIKLKDAYN